MLTKIYGKILSAFTEWKYGHSICSTLLRLKWSTKIPKEFCSWLPSSNSFFIHELHSICEPMYWMKSTLCCKLYWIRPKTTHLSNAMETKKSLVCITKAILSKSKATSLCLCTFLPTPEEHEVAILAHNKVASNHIPHLKKWPGQIFMETI